MKVKILFVGLLLFQATFAWGKIKIKDIRMGSETERKLKLRIEYSGIMRTEPELTFGPKMIQVSIPDSIVWPKLEKRVSSGHKPYDTTLMAYQYNKQLVRVRALLPYELTNEREFTMVELKPGVIEVEFPKQKIKQTQSTYLAKPKIVESSKSEIPKLPEKKQKVSKIDEKYLQKLLDESNEKKKTQVEHPISNRAAAVKRSKEKASSLSHSLTKYAAKFAGFLAVVIILFLGVVTLFKKGVTKKGKLGFLKSDNLVEVLNTTYIAPKRNLLLVKVHNQVVLLGNSESGIQYLTEVKDLPGLLKSGEHQLTGSTFDSTYGSIDEINKDIKLKDEDQRQSFAATLGLDQSNEAVVNKQQSRISEQIKEKLRSMKSFQ